MNTTSLTIRQANKYGDGYLEKSLYNKLKKDLGLSDAVNEYIEVLVRKFAFEALSETEFQKIAALYNIKVNDISVDDAISKIRRYYIVSIYQIQENFFISLNDYLNRYAKGYREKKDGESMLKYLCYRLLDMQKVNDEPYLYYLICDYYRLVRNYVVHIEDTRKIDNAYSVVKERSADISDRFQKLAAPNNIGEIAFDDFVLYSRSLKKLAKKLLDEVQYDLDKVAESIDFRKYSKQANSPDSIRNSIKFELQISFRLNSEETNYVVEKIMKEM